MQLFSSAARCLSRSQTSQVFLFQQFNKIHSLTPICTHPNFLQSYECHRNFGVRKTLTCSPQAHQLLKSFHTQNVQFLKYTNCLENKSETKDKKTTKSDIDDNNDFIRTSLDETKKLGLFQRFKKMAKDYWYVLIPVHVATSACWFGAFYYTSTSGVDIVGILESYNFSEKIISPLRNSSLGHIAVAYFLYKIATPARYFVTVAGTTMTIKQGMKYGFIKPMPSRDKLVQIYKDKKDEMQQKIQDKRDEVNEKIENKKQAIRDKYMRK